jgi:putative nucleotidyltransferase with HDIG domain
MSDPTAFLHSFAQALSVLSLYPEGHPSRERAIDSAYQALHGLTDTNNAPPSFTFLEGEVVYGREPLRDFKDWDFGYRLAAAGIERLQVERVVSRDEFEGLLQEINARLTMSSVSTSENRQMRSLGIRFGSVGVKGHTIEVVKTDSGSRAPNALSLAEELETLKWLQDEVQSEHAVPLIEAEAIVRSLSVAMHAERGTVLPLLQLKEFDQYTTTHSLNVSVLAMALAEAIGCRKSEIRALGMAGLLHDIGKIKIPLQILTKPGKLSADERRIINKHPVDGAKMILQSNEALDIAAVVAYEHHIMLDGGGYPTPHYGRDTAVASRLVHVCDVYDALRTKRPYRDAWESGTVFNYLVEHSGTEFDPDLVKAFIEMMHRTEIQISSVTENLPATAGQAVHTEG